MSIYPVDFKNDGYWKKYLDDVEFLIEGNSCIACNKPMKDSKEAWLYHVVPWGYSPDKVWCSKKCAYGVE